MPQHKSVTRSRKAPKKSVSRKSPKKSVSRQQKDPKKTKSRSHISPKNRSYRLSSPEIAPEKYKCVTPYNKGTAPGKQRVASCNTYGTSAEGHPELYENLQLCTQACFLSDDEVRESKMKEENDQESKMKEWMAQYESSNAERKKRSEEYSRNYDRKKKIDEEAREKEAQEEENKFLDRLSDQLIKKIKEIAISFINTTEINNLIKDIPMFLHAWSKPREDALTRIAVRVKDSYSRYESASLNISNISDKVQSYCIAYLEKMEDKKEERGEKRTYPKNGFSMSHVSTYSTHLMMSLNKLIDESKDSIWTNLLYQSKHFNLEEDLKILLRDYRSLLLYDNVESIRNIIIKCADEKGMECLEKEASKNCSIM
jgi:hypothetical protein